MLKYAKEIQREGGAVLASRWTSGTGRFTSRRTTPKFCAEIKAQDVGTLKGKTAQAAKRILRNHPRARFLICLIDRRGFNAAAKRKEGAA